MSSFQGYPFRGVPIVYTMSQCRQLSASPFDKDLLCTCYGTVQENKSRVLCHLWRLGEEGESEPSALQDVCPLTHQANVRWSVERERERN